MHQNVKKNADILLCLSPHALSCPHQHIWMTLPNQALKCPSASPSSFLTLPLSPPLRSYLRVGFLCGFVYWMQPLLEAIRAGFPHYLPVSTETRQCYGNAGPSHGAERKERRGFTKEDNGSRTHTPTQSRLQTRTHIHASPQRNHFSVLAVPSLCKYNLAFNASA